MSGPVETFRGAIFDGEVLHEDRSINIINRKIISFSAENDAPVVNLQGDILAPGFVDLQVNGGGGVNFNDDPSPETLRRIAEAHRGLGATSILPTLITDRPEVTSRAIDAAIAACRDRVPGIAGLHLEGPHLSRARCGAHPPDLIRPMDDADLADLCAAAARLPCLLVTVAPEGVSVAQVSAMARAGIVVMLGHSDCDGARAARYFAAGAQGVTHLFNAMSQMTARAPGLVGAALSAGVWCGLIADGVHVAPMAMRVALAANPRILLVSDAMAVAGTTLTEFHLGDRRVLRKNNELRLEDGTLAGADLDLARAVSVLTSEAGDTLAGALARVTSMPARLAGLEGGAGFLRPGDPFRAVRLRPGPEGLRVVETYG
ncbi:N-acetylglucosamine-6-phosphate deacetylase [Roseivivax lentus]|uniref:N-acetylglucosamine-6-phosphate deacetylase n=1 Tax=Roseivivax lentus TaxID=633194 RepID=A0A1N7N7B8_9RHOB|nr:N-acetylglucosamine-6-phosphate deacetylase [Roseivivax lentus]SIS94242.1 N-acetylglucosamine-6-phosphate deacetylase [Roseivivax lentus]